jgi:hypothetical protein
MANLGEVRLSFNRDDRVDGYQLHHTLETHGVFTYERGNQRYRLQYFGERTSVSNGLLVVQEGSGQTRRFRGGYSSEACWNFLTTVEEGRWDHPVGKWRNPENVDVPSLTDWEKLSGCGEVLL